MSVNKGIAVKLANRLFRENQNGRAFRTMTREDYPMVKAGTLNRFVKSKGKWLPKDESILIALGLMKPHKPKSPPPIIEAWQRVIRKKIAVMAKQTRRDLGLQK